MILRKSMISIAAATVLAVGFAGCNGTATTTSTTDASNTLSKVNTPKGTVTGLVQDTNGNPIAGVKVYLADKNATTTAGGLYTFNDVPVTTTNGADAVNANQVLSVTIVAPTGYLGATVTVTPGAQIDSAEGATTTSGVETFIDGYLAQAGTAVLPQLNATVKGTLRDNTTGAALANTTVHLDLTAGGTGAIAQEQNQNLVGTTYAVSDYVVTTDANGAFTLSNVPSDSSFTPYVPGYTINACPAFTTVREAQTDIGSCLVTKVTSRDAIAPMVKSITGQIANANPVMLEDNIRQTIVVNFTEAIASLSEIDKDVTNSVTVYNTTTSKYLTQTATIAGSALTIVLDTALGDAQLIDINLLVTDFKDAAGNFLTQGGSTVVYDSNVSAGQAIRLKVSSYNDLNQDAQTPTAAAQQTADANGVKDWSTIQAANASFNDVSNSGNGKGNFSQLNFNSDSNVTDAAARLGALATALNSGTGITMTTNVARATFTTSNAASYKVTVKTSAGAAKDINATNVAVYNLANVGTVADNAATGAGKADSSFTFTPKASTLDATAIEFTYSNAAHNDVITITPLDDFAYAGTATSITLKDNVAPTTILQKAYGAAGTNTHTGSSTVVKYGDGGELSANTGTATVGTPYLPITPGLLDNLTAAGVAINATGANRASDNSLQAELSNLSKKNASGNYEYTNTATMTANIYDATAWTAFTSLTRTVGVAFSEDVDLTGVTPTFDGTEALTYAVSNDVTVNDDNGTVSTTGNVDLVEVTTTDIFKLANDNNGKIINFAGILDKVGNASTTASVVLKDEMPPFVTKATWNGTSLVLTFNEAVSAISTYSATGTARDSNISFGAGTDAYFLTKDKNVTLDATAKIMTINDLNNTQAAALQTALDAGQTYVEAAYGTATYNHTAITPLGVKDVLGNTWKTNLSNIAVPKFAAIDIVPNLNYTVSGQSTNNLSFTATFNQNVKEMFDLNATGLLATNSIYFDNNTSTKLTVLTSSGTAAFLRRMYVSHDRNTSRLIDDLNVSDGNNTLSWGTAGTDINVSFSGTTLVFQTLKTKTNAVAYAMGGAVTTVSTINFKVSSDIDSTRVKQQRAKYTKTVSIAAQ